MTEDLERLPDDVMAVLATAKPLIEPTPAARRRVWSAVAARVSMTPGGGGGGSQSGPMAPHGVKGWLQSNLGISLAGALLVGGAVGALARGSGDTSVVNVPVVVTTSSASLQAPRGSTSDWTVVTPAPSVSAAPAPLAKPVRSAEVTTGQQLAAESALLDMARTAIARGEADHALVAVERHAATFPDGMLREEREALGVKALVLAGRADEAKQRAARFRTRYPESLFLGAIDGALRSLAAPTPSSVPSSIP